MIYNSYVLYKGYGGAMLKIKNGYLILSFLLLTFLFTGCAETPTRVKEEILELEKAKLLQTELEKEITTIKVIDLYENTPSTYQFETGMLSFDGSIIVPKVDELYLLSMEPNRKIFDSIEHTFSTIIEYKSIKDAKKNAIITVDDKEDDIYSKEKVYRLKAGMVVEMDPYTLISTSIGMTSIFINDILSDEQHINMVYKPNNTLEQLVFVNETFSDLEKTIKFKDGITTIEACKEDFESEIKMFQEICPELNLKLYNYIMSTQKETNIQGIKFRALQTYKDVFFDYTKFVNQDARQSSGISYVGMLLDKEYHSINDDCGVFLRDSYLTTAELQTYSSIIDFESALKILTIHQAKNRIVDIESAELLY